MLAENPCGGSPPILRRCSCGRWGHTGCASLPTWVPERALLLVDNGRVLDLAWWRAWLEVEGPFGRPCPSPVPMLVRDLAEHGAAMLRWTFGDELAEPLQPPPYGADLVGRDVWFQSGPETWHVVEVELWGLRLRPRWVVNDARDWMWTPDPACESPLLISAPTPAVA